MSERTVNPVKTKGLNKALIAELHNENLVRRIERILREDDMQDSVKLSQIFYSKFATQVTIITNKFSYELHFFPIDNSLKTVKLDNFNLIELSNMLKESNQR
ncbi:hypothetical protein GI584_00130 [Gracilibacillus salitolerans]|uniref:Uncharacterized protein n=1 Tax=Gracilibacillus salitolerans TaxID=2663022 RepID=A0A5Q2TDB9_9BACI|nr:hypothetical protein [Gracilibacillus salitolerans]QGH32586.1 hypothetical protein GI584_00130 [Gracilibacillus salitolerans]